jgi:alkaline phosphatase
MSSKKLIGAALMTAVTAVTLTVPAGPALADRDDDDKKVLQRARNVIFMVPDGMGLADVTAARIFKNGPDGENLSFENLPVIGYQRTHSANSTVTDSAAAAAAWAVGDKFLNGQISCHDGDMDFICDEPVVPTLLERAASMGKSTGLVASSTITHATPAAFGAHVHIRKCETEIARQYVKETGVDVMLGGGFGPDTSACMTPSPLTGAQIIDQAESMYGYTYVETKTEMFNAAADGAMRILGLFTPGGKTPETYRVDSTLSYPAEEPTLPEMVAVALEALEKDRHGFFLVIEGSQIDWAGHANAIEYQIGETLAFDEAVQVVMDWVNERPWRKRKTTVVVVADHETGGFAINGPYGTLSVAGDIVEDGWTTGGHTASDVLIWSQGPGSRRLGNALDNTDLYGILKKVLH